MSQYSSYVIVGFMGSGKTTFLSELKNRKNLSKFNFFDLDKFIEMEKKCEIKDLINSYGMAKFREIEFLHLAALLKSETSVVISLGGGALHKDSYHLIKKLGVKIIWLDTPFRECLSRIRKDGNIRPLNNLSDQELEELFKNEKKFYERADFTLPKDKEKLLQYMS